MPGVARPSTHTHTAKIKYSTATLTAREFLFAGFFQSARRCPCTHPSGKGETQLASPVAPHAHDKGRWEGSACPLGDEIIPCKYVTHYRESKIHMQRASKSITGSVLTADQSLKLLALLLLSSLYKYTSACAAVQSSVSTGCSCSVYHFLCSFGHGPLQTD